jgi:hypothetical protein
MVLLLRVSSIDLTRAKRRAWQSRVDMLECILEEVSLRVERVTIGRTKIDFYETALNKNGLKAKRPLVLPLFEPREFGSLKVWLAWWLLFGKLAGCGCGRSADYNQQKCIALSSVISHQSSVIRRKLKFDSPPTARSTITAVE